MSILNFLSSTLGENPGDYNRRDFKGNPLTAEEIYESFTEWISTRGMTLYPAQDEVVLSIAAGHNVVLATPTGSGKSTVAVAAHFTGWRPVSAPTTPPPLRRWCLRSSLT